MLQFADFHSHTFTCIQVLLHFVDQSPFARSPTMIRLAIQSSSNSSTSIAISSPGGSCGGPGHVGRICKGVPSGGDGALHYMHSGTGELGGVGLFLKDSGTALTGGPSI